MEVQTNFTITLNHLCYFRADKSFSQALHDGRFKGTSSDTEVTASDVDMSAAYNSVSSAKGNGLELQLYTKLA